MKKLITVCWSTTIETDVPEEIGVEELTSHDAAEMTAQIRENAIHAAYYNISEKDGEITDVQTDY